MEYSRTQGDILAAIVRSSREALEFRKAETPLHTLIPRARCATPRDFRRAIEGGKIAVIAEMKKASPSAGILCPHYQPAAIARAYEQAGAAALSVLTEERYFLGKLAHLDAVRQAVTIPVLRKDFITDEYQVYESAAAGADAVLLIARLLNARELTRLVALCAELRMTPLVEIHAEDEVARAVSSRAPIIGINNRDLRTLQVSIDRSIALKGMLPADRLIVSESGIAGRGDIDRLVRAGIHVMLVGESLLRAVDPGLALAQLLGE